MGVGSYDGKNCLVAPSSSFLFNMKIREAFIHCKDEIVMGSHTAKGLLSRGHSLVLSRTGTAKKEKR